MVECWLRVREVQGLIPGQGPYHTKDVIQMVPVVPLFGTLKREILALSHELRWDKKKWIQSGTEVLQSRRPL